MRRLRFGDVLATGTVGLRTRVGRSVLTAIGIAIGIAAIVAVQGISASSRADLLAQIDQLGTNLLQVRPGNDVFGQAATLPEDAPAMIGRIGPVTDAAGLSRLDAAVRRHTYDDEPNGLDVLAAGPELAMTLEATLATGTFLTGEDTGLPVVVLGAVAAERLGIDDLAGGPTVDIAGRRFQVVGILEPLALNPDVDRSVLIGKAAAEEVLGAEVTPTSVYLRAEPDQVEAVRAVVARTANPTAPNEVDVARPSDALEARAQVDEGLRNLLLGLGAVALVVGGVGIANVMVISVLERRAEIGVRRALGATRGHIRAQFLVEATVLALMGGVIGVALGSAVTAGYASGQGWRLAVPVEGLVAAVLAALALGAVAGLYPASRAARIDPADAVRPGG
jgi:putative ABC transport system permease protein